MTTNRYKDLICLDGMSQKDWQIFEGNFLKQKHVDLRKQFYFSGAFVTELDRHHRLLISSHLRESANLKEKLVLVGLSGKFEIWGDGEWKKFSQSLFKDFKDSLSNLALKDS